jgi:hypothetical protein
MLSDFLIIGLSDYLTVSDYVLQDRDKDFTGTIGLDQLLDIYRIYEVKH